jgi:hypothetical protein
MQKWTSPPPWVLPVEEPTELLPVQKRAHCLDVFFILLLVLAAGGACTAEERLCFSFWCKRERVFFLSLKAVVCALGPLLLRVHSRLWLFI